MKILLSVLLSFLSFIVMAQGKKMQKKFENTLSNTYPNALWIDSSGNYFSCYGKVARLKYDNMPCIMPSHSTNMPNAFNGKVIPKNIPNGWSKDSSKQK